MRFYTMLGTVVMSFLTVLWMESSEVILAEGICERYTALCRYAERRHRSSSPGALCRLYGCSCRAVL